MLNVNKTTMSSMQSAYLYLELLPAAKFDPLNVWNTIPICTSPGIYIRDARPVLRILFSHITTQ